MDAIAPGYVSQRRIDSIVSRGIFFSVLWLMGFGSFVALLKGLEARQLILRSSERRLGIGGAWWCIVAGGVGIAIWLPVVVLGLYNVLRS